METSSTAGSPISDSWMFVGNDPEAAVAATKSGEEIQSEDSDGISVISESEMFKNPSNQHSDSDEDKLKIEKGEEVSDPNLLTPPVTPSCNFNDENDAEEPENDQEDEKKIETIEKSESQQLEVHQEAASGVQLAIQSHGSAMLLAVMALIIALLYTNVSSLKNEMRATVSIYEQRIAMLEEENQILKSQLNELIKQLKVADQVRDDDILKPINNFADQFIDENFLEERFIEKQKEAMQKPITKDVWMGGEKEDVVKILDKKLNSLPDYCYFTDESDLFYEYNKENCERKKRKLDERVRKFREKNDRKAESVDDIYKTPQDSSYDDYIRQTTNEHLQSLNDEIQDIKSSRISHSITDIDEDLPYSPNDDAIIERPITKEETFQDKKEGKKIKKQKEKRPFEQKNNQDGIKKHKFEPENNRDELKNRKFEPESQNKRSKKRKQKGSEEWIDRRSMGRAQARKKHDDNDSEENWFIKRKNDREIHRLEH